jgi:hypothetical protein
MVDCHAQTRPLSGGQFALASGESRQLTDETERKYFSFIAGDWRPTKCQGRQIVFRDSTSGAGKYLRRELRNQ